jgi:glycosyltransferase involved in cell wall biosynthesis
MHVVIATPFRNEDSGVLSMYARELKGAFEKEGILVSLLSLDRMLFLPPLIRQAVFFVRVLFAMPHASCVLSLDTWSIGMPAYFAARLANRPFLMRVGGDHLWEHYVERTKESVRLSEFYDTKRAYSLREKIIFTVTKSMLAHAHAVMFNTEFQKRIWEKAYTIPAGTTSVLENYYPQKTSSAPRINRIFICAARPTRYKNVEVFARVFKKVREKHPDITLDTQTVGHKEQQERLAAAYALVIPSISEVGSNTAIEAVSVGTPFIITKDTGTSERLGECGLFVDTRSEEALERALEEVLDPVVYERLCRNIREFSFEHSWDDIASEILVKV